MGKFYANKHCVSHCCEAEIIISPRVANWDRDLDGYNIALYDYRNNTIKSAGAYSRQVAYAVRTWLWYQYLEGIKLPNNVPLYCPERVIKLKTHEKRAIRSAVRKLLSDRASSQTYSIARQAVQLAQVRAKRCYDYLTQREALEYASSLTGENRHK